MPQFTRTQKSVLTGDVAVLVLLTIIGFATHLTLDAFGRLIVTALGLVLAWAIVAPFFGVYDERAIETPGELWRVAWAAIAAAPMAAFLRGMVLNRDIPWVFILVTMLTSSFGLIAWRILYGWAVSRRRRVVRDR
jgi:FlaA1/EpsC-like NDP-sugar epimerase